MLEPLASKYLRAAYHLVVTRFLGAEPSAPRRVTNLRGDVADVGAELDRRLQLADRPAVLKTVKSADLDDSLNEFAWSLGAQDDHHASARYRRQLVRTLGKQLLA